MSDTESDSSASADVSSRKGATGLAALFNKKSKKEKEEVVSDSSEEEEEEEDTEDSAEEDSDAEEESDEEEEVVEVKLTKRQKQEAALDMLQKLQRCDRSVYVSVPFVGQSDSYDRIKTAFDKWSRLKGRSSAVDMQKMALGATVRAVEALASRVISPETLDLEGLSAAIQPELDDPKNDEIFEELYDKYGSMFGTEKQSPEWRLLMLLVKSGAMFIAGKKLANMMATGDLMKFAANMQFPGASGRPTGGMATGGMATGGMGGGGMTHGNGMSPMNKAVAPLGERHIDMLEEIRIAKANLEARNKQTFAAPSAISGVSHTFNSKGQSVALL